MLIKKNILGYFIWFILFAFSQCKKNSSSNSDNNYGLPNASQDGSRVFACRLNGQNRIANGNINAQNALVTSDSVSVFAGFAGKGYFERVTITVYGKAQVNHEYKIEDAAQCHFLYDTDSTCFGNSTNVTVVTIAYGSVIFTRIDSTAKIVSGRYEFNVPMVGCDTLYFTGGRFDVLY